MENTEYEDQRNRILSALSFWTLTVNTVKYTDLNPFQFEFAVDENL